jgi:hypothetical protein
MLQVHSDGLALTASAASSREVYCSSPVAATLNLAHLYVTSTATIFGVVTLQVHSDGLALTASAASSCVTRLLFFPSRRNIWQPRTFVCYIDGHHFRCRDVASPL